MDIEKLRLNEEEMTHLYSQWKQSGTFSVAGKDWDDTLADAQLAKALWGVAEWLHALSGIADEEERLAIYGVYARLRDNLEAEGIPRPEVMKET